MCDTRTEPGVGGEGGGRLMETAAGGLCKNRVRGLGWDRGVESGSKRRRGGRDLWKKRNRKENINRSGASKTRTTRRVTVTACDCPVTACDCPVTACDCPVTACDRHGV